MLTLDSKIIITLLSGKYVDSRECKIHFFFTKIQLLFIKGPKL